MPDDDRCGEGAIPISPEMADRLSPANHEAQLQRQFERMMNARHASVRTASGAAQWNSSAANWRTPRDEEDGNG